MFRFLRKHRWILIIAMAVTAISFVTFMGSGPSRNGGGGATGDFGSIYGHKITQRDYVNAQNEFKLFYFFQNLQWPANIPEKDLQEQIYLRLMLTQKAESLGVHVSDNEAATAAAAALHSLDRNGQRVTFEDFKKVLKQEGLTEEDFMRFARNDLVIQQLIQTLGLTGQLVTPQEAAEIYGRDYQEVAAQAVFFSASNYLSQITVTPGIAAQFYTNYMAEYRLPDRVQVSYVEFNVSNYLSAAEQRIGKTNLDDQVDATFRRYGMDAVPGAKTDDEAKTKIRAELLRQGAAAEARKLANDFATEVFDKTPLRPENLAAVAKEKGLTVRTTAPFGSQYGPEEFLAPAAFVKAAFALTHDDLFAGPIAGNTSFYVIALAQQLPAEIPSLDSIRERVTADYKNLEAAALARRDGTNFFYTLTMQLSMGKTFASACAAAGFHPETLSPFSLATKELPELAERVNFQQVKQAAFSTPPGHAGNFEETDNGGFIVFVDKKLPLDRTAMNAKLPQFTEQLRRERANEVFQSWIQTEANREFRNIPAFQKQAAAGVK
ncbi:MAG TPA: SurA N-terminal domain-containing protein [Methylomirabilota bacterium]|nr:SurA N-terminal domain-containing protein [Methylomirabilota bacterium]